MARSETTIKDEDLRSEAHASSVPAVHKNQLPAEYDFGEDAGVGMEDLRREEFKLPIFRILDVKSPQCKDPSEGGIEGAKAGMILNTATSEIYPGRPDGIGFVPVKRDWNYVEYIARNDGGGFVGFYQPDDPLVRKLIKEQGHFKKLKRFNDHPDINKNTEIVETYYLFGLLIPDEDTVVMGVIPFTSTQIPKYQAFVTRYDSIRYPNSRGEYIKPPLWAHKWQLRTKPESNRKGDYQGWVIKLLKEPPRESLMRLDDPIYQQGKAYHELIISGAGKIDQEADSKAGGPQSEGGADEEIPF